MPQPDRATAVGRLRVADGFGQVRFNRALRVCALEIGGARGAQYREQWRYFAPWKLPVTTGGMGSRAAVRLNPSATGPIPGAHGAGMIATKRPFAACGKLTLPIDESSQNTGSARV